MHVNFEQLCSFFKTPIPCLSKLPFIDIVSLYRILQADHTTYRTQYERTSWVITYSSTKSSVVFVLNTPGAGVMSQQVEVIALLAWLIPGAHMVERGNHLL